MDTPAPPVAPNLDDIRRQISQTRVYVRRNGARWVPFREVIDRGEAALLQRAALVAYIDQLQERIRQLEATQKE